ncbi:gustatory receptor for sugar taste 64a-like [Aricia agestis]|uniref:gustatory receptor for sugar taste 64a-like n=1 Tax=Aricia agestis TaxID=91739 RepID=UPI001C2057A0|nr:gustatory receptor for sugar taste 64a-like [Aricia agestis]
MYQQFLATMTSIFTLARWFGVPTYGGRLALFYSLVLLSMLIALEAGSIRKLVRLLTGVARNTSGGRGFIARLSGTVFYGNALLSLCLSWQMAYKWRTLSVYWLYTETRGPYLPPNEHIRRKVIWIASFIGVCAVVEHVLSMMSATGFNIPPGEYFQRYILSSHGFLLQNYEYNLWLAIPIFILSKYATILWNFQDLVVILLSVGLASRYRRLNAAVAGAVREERMGKERIKGAIDVSNRLRVWRKIREGYVQQAALVRRVDTEIGSLILLCNLNNLFFICLQLFLGIRISHTSVTDTVYYFASLGWLLLRAGGVVLSAADVNLHSKRALTAISRCPCSAYNVEIKRLKQQLIHDEVALSGKGFFYLDRQMLLEVAAAIVKYELMLIQYDQ